MCGRYVDPDEAAIERAWKIDRQNWKFPEPARYNIPPAAQVPIVIRAGDGALEMLGARWGLIPSWWNKDKLPQLSFNARSEEAATKPLWREAMRSSRCIMPIRGWYEWNENEPVKAVSGRTTNQPYFHFCPDDPVLAVAGLWAVWATPDGNEIVSCALLSRAAAPAIAHVHDRMPVILRPGQVTEWLDPATSLDRVLELIASARSDFHAHRVSTLVNSVRNDGPHLISALESPDDLELF